MEIHHDLERVLTSFDNIILKTLIKNLLEDATFGQNFKSPVLKSIIKKSEQEQKPVVGAKQVDKFNEDFGIAWSKLDGEKDDIKSAQAIVCELAINFLVANPDIRDVTERYLSRSIAAKLRIISNDWRHYGARKYLQQLLADFTPASQSTLRLR